jgi:hypothetical protein
MGTPETKDQLRMPSLSNLDTSLRGKRFLGRIMGVHGPPSTRGLQIAAGFVRLVEKTIIEYESTRRNLFSFFSDGLMGNYFRAQDHLETCLQSLHRAILYLIRLRRLGFRQADGKPFVPRPRDLEILSKSVRSRVQQIRDASEHLDKDIINGQIPEDAEVAIHLGWQSVKLGDTEIRYEEISGWLGQLHHFAVLLSKIELVVGCRATNRTKGNRVTDVHVERA